MPQPHPSQRFRSGFTLIEMLVVIAVIGLLVSITIPAVQSARGNARRAVCKSNLKQIGLAAQEFQDINNRKMVPGYLGPMNPDGTPIPTHSLLNDGIVGQNIGPIPFLLPYFEQENVFKEMKGYEMRVEVSAGEWWRDPQMFLTAQTRLNLLHCPDTEVVEPNARPIVAVNTYKKPGDPPNIDFVTNANALTLAKTNYLACAGQWGFTNDPTFDLYQGVFTNRSQTESAAIQDGESHTILFGETAGELDTRLHQTRFIFTWLAGPLNTDRGIGDTNPDPNVNNSIIKEKFNSMHHSVVHFLFADGRTDAVNVNIDARNFNRLGGMDDGETFDFAP